MFRRYYFIVLLLLVSSLSAQTTTTFSGTSGIEDSWLNRGSQTTNYGAADTLLIQNAYSVFSTAVLRALNITDTIPATAIIIDCFLKVHIEQTTGNKQIQTYRICKNWLEDDAVTGVTHNQAQKGVPGVDWASPGAIISSTTDCDSCGNVDDGTGEDREGTIQTSATFSDTGWVTIPVDTCHANAWLSGRDVNNGIQLFDNGLGGNFNTITITSSEGAYSPEFIFVWIDASGVSNERHGADGVGVRHSGDGASARHGG